MRKFFAPLILSLFFFIPFKVNAATTVNITIPDTYFTIFNSPGFANWYNSTLYNTTNYVVIKTEYNNSNYSLLSQVEKTYSCSIFNRTDNSILCTASPSNGVLQTVYDASDFSIIRTNTNVSANISLGMFYGALRWPVISTYIFTLSGENLQYNFIVGNNVIYSLDCQDGKTCVFPTLLDLYKINNPDPIPPPPQSYPLLTTFYTVVIDKIGEICTFFTSNYLYLSVFVIFLFYISILLLRRFIK